MIQVMGSTMALSMDYMTTFQDIDFSGCNGTNYSAADDPYHQSHSNWNHWSPVVDWDSFPLVTHDEFKDLMDMDVHKLDDDEEEEEEEEEAKLLVCSPRHLVVEDVSNCNSGGSSNDMTIVTDEEFGEEDKGGGGGDIKGLKLVHLLIAAAEALNDVDQSYDLARVILVRLNELVSSTDGTTMERLASHFTHALQGLLDHKHHFIASGPHHHHSHRDDQPNPTDVLAAFQLLQDISPYIKFGHFTANQAILEAVANERRVHIVDYDVMEGIQWASFMQSLVSRKDGSPAPHLRITAITRGGGGAGRKSPSMSSVQETGRRLTAFAASIGQPFSFHQCRLDSDETFRPSVLKLVRGEALVVNCMLHLPHLNYRTPDSVMSFLSGAKSLNPRVITLVEEEVGLTNGGFYAWFVDSLHHYSAMYDSLEAGFPMQNKSRSLVERVFLGPQIAGSLARIYCSQGRGGEKKTGLSWGEWLGGVGFRGVPISYGNHCQAKLLLGLFNDGYRVEEMGNNKLVLGWKSRRLFSASVWAPPPNLDFDSCTGSVP